MQLPSDEKSGAPLAFAALTTVAIDHLQRCALGEGLQALPKNPSHRRGKRTIVLTHA
mgnify:CR=1 FL=1